MCSDLDISFTYLFRYLWVEWVIMHRFLTELCAFCLTHSQTNELIIRPGNKLHALYTQSSNYDSLKTWISTLVTKSRRSLKIIHIGESFGKCIISVISHCLSFIFITCSLIVKTVPKFLISHWSASQMSLPITSNLSSLVPHLKHVGCRSDI